MPARSSAILSTSWASPSDKIMEKAQVERINYLARESKVRELTAEEKAEQAELRQEYLADIRASFGGMLDNTVIKRPDGSIERVKDKKDKK